jgi:arsenate reductase
MDREAALLKALADPTRLRLAVLLARRGETCVCRLVEALGMPQSSVSRHLAVLRNCGLVEARREGTWMHYRLASPSSRFEKCLHTCFGDCLADNETSRRDLARLAAECCASPEPAACKAKRLRVLFLCTGNSCRSQMAEGWARFLKSDCIEAHSAGIETHGLNPSAVRVMAEAGVNISGHRSKLVGEFADTAFDYVVTVCGHAHETCPFFPGGAKVIHVGFDDPPKLAAAVEGEEAKLDCYRRVRDQIRAFVESLPGRLEQEQA